MKALSLLTALFFICGCGLPRGENFPCRDQPSMEQCAKTKGDAAVAAHDLDSLHMIIVLLPALIIVVPFVAIAIAIKNMLKGTDKTSTGASLDGETPPVDKDQKEDDEATQVFGAEL